MHVLVCFMICNVWILCGCVCMCVCIHVCMYLCILERLLQWLLRPRTTCMLLSPSAPATFFNHYYPSPIFHRSISSSPTKRRYKFHTTDSIKNASLLTLPLPIKPLSGLFINTCSVLSYFTIVLILMILFNLIVVELRFVDRLLYVH